VQLLAAAQKINFLLPERLVKFREISNFCYLPVSVGRLVVSCKVAAAQIL
jgi:hypothetical protein